MIRRLLQRRRMAREHGWSSPRLSEYLDRELGPAERERLEAHVRICPQCHRILGTLRSTLRALAGMRLRPVPGLADDIVERLREQR